jgi:hypothetical protein
MGTGASKNNPDLKRNETIIDNEDIKYKRIRWNHRNNEILYFHYFTPLQDKEVIKRLRRLCDTYRS